MMRSVLFAVLWLGLCLGSAFGQTQVRPQPGNFSPVGYQQITSLSAATAPTVPSGVNAVIAVICVEAQAVRYRDDGTNPTATVGMPVTAGSCIQTVTNVLPTTKFIEQTSGAILNISYYKNN